MRYVVWSYIEETDCNFETDDEDTGRGHLDCSDTLCESFGTLEEAQDYQKRIEEDARLAHLLGIPPKVNIDMDVHSFNNPPNKEEKE